MPRLYLAAEAAQQLIQPPVKKNKPVAVCVFFFALTKKHLFIIFDFKILVKNI